MLNKDKMVEILNKVSKGSNQYLVLRDLLEYGETDGLGCYITTNKYYSKYIQSYFNAVERLKALTGLDIKFHYGKNGGYYSGYFEIVS